MLSESVSQASSCLSNVNLVAGTTFDNVYHVVACTGVLGIDGDRPPGVLIVGEALAWAQVFHRETYYDLRQKQLFRSDDFSLRCHAGCYRGGTHTKLVMVGKCLQCLGHLAASGSF